MKQVRSKRTGVVSIMSEAQFDEFLESSVTIKNFEITDIIVKKIVPPLEVKSMPPREVKPKLKSKLNEG